MINVIVFQNTIIPQNQNDSCLQNLHLQGLHNMHQLYQRIKQKDVREGVQFKSKNYSFSNFKHHAFIINIEKNIILIYS